MSSADRLSRRVQIVLEGHQSAIALMRALQFQEHFKQHPRYQADFFFRTPPVLSSGSQQWLRRVQRRLLVGPLYRQAVSFQERRIVEQAPGYDLVYTVGTPSLSLHRRLAGQRGSRLVMDMIDGLWLPYHRQFGWQGLEEMLATSDAVVCENQYTAEFARKHNPQVFVAPNAPQLDVFDRWRSHAERDGDEIILGWVGTAVTSASLHAIWEPLESLFARHNNLHLRILGGVQHRIPAFEKVRYSLLPKYDQEQMVREVLGMDIGLFPLFDVEDSLTRGSSKARIYMSGEAAAICQNLGASRDLIQDGANGMLAGTRQEWLDKLERLVENRDERQRIAREGLETIRAEYSTAKCFERLIGVFDAVLE